MSREKRHRPFIGLSQITAKKDELFMQSDSDENSPVKKRRQQKSAGKAKYIRNEAFKELFGNSDSESDIESDDISFADFDVSDDESECTSQPTILVEDTDLEDDEIHPLHGRIFPENVADSEYESDGHADVDQMEEDNAKNYQQLTHSFPDIAGCTAAAYDCKWLPVFQKQSGVIVDYQNQMESEIFLRLLGGDAALDVMVSETNRYAQQYVASKGGPENHV